MKSSCSGEVKIREIAEFMGRSEVFVRDCIMNGSLPIGCYSKKGEKASFYISPKRAYEWLGYEREESDCRDSADVNGDDS